MSNQNIMPLMTNCYRVGANTSAQTITLVAADVQLTSLEIENTSLTAGMFVVSSDSTAPNGAVTAAFPTSNTVPVKGKYVGPGKSFTYTKDRTHNTISVIATAIDASGYAYVSAATGE